MKKILFVGTVLLMMGSIFLSGASSVVANAVINSESIQSLQNINTDYNTLKNSFVRRGFHAAEENTFYYEGLQYTKYFSDNDDIGIIELGADFITAYTLKRSSYFYILNIEENAAGTILYKQFTKNGDPVNRLSRRAITCTGL